MDIRKALLVKSFRELLTITACLITATNASYIYPRGRDQNEYNLSYVVGTSEKLRFILGSCKIRSIFYTENTLRKIE